MMVPHLGMSLIVLLFCGFCKCLATVEYLEFGQNLPVTPFRTFTNILIGECEFECKSRKKCKAYAYRRHLRYCMLLNVDSSRVKPVRDPETVLSEKQFWNQKTINPSCDTKCEETEVCRVTTSGVVACPPAECGNPTLIAGTIRYGNLWETESSMAHACEGTDVVTGQHNYTVFQSECTISGRWTMPRSQVKCFIEVPGFVQYMGCFLDERVRVIRESLTGDSVRMTILKCAQICYRRGQRYFGVEAGYACLCGNTFHTIGPAWNCDTACTGNSQEMCGGSWAIQMYIFHTFK